MSARKEPVRQILIRLPESLYAEILVFHPEMTTSEGHMKYGAIQNYFARLAREELETVKQRIRSQHDIEKVRVFAQLKEKADD